MLTTTTTHTPLHPTLEPKRSPCGRTEVDSYVIPETGTLTALLWGFANHPNLKAKEYYFWRIAELLWCNPELPEPLFIRHEWAEEIIWECLNNKYLSVGGAASSGKSHTLAGYGIIQWLSRPRDTMVLITSTSLREARKRVWGSVIRLLSVIEGAPINIRDSIGSANYVDENGTTFDTAGLSLIAAERSRTKEAIGKLIGIKQKRLILIADELGELSESIISAAIANLSKNPFFQCVGLSNPSSRFDAFGIWSAPMDGWDTVDVMLDFTWKTRWGGKYIRLDGERSPNIKAGYTKYVFLPSEDQIVEDKRLMGETSRLYYRMIRAVFFDSDEDDSIYSEADLIRNKATQLTDFVGKTDKICGIDPAFTNGGDATMMVFATVGVNTAGQLAIRFDEAITINDDVTNKAVPRTYQIVEIIKRECAKRKVPASNVAIDATGAGAPFCDVVAGEWDSGILRVSFGGVASEKRVSQNSKLVGSDVYVNRVTELWFIAKELMRNFQVFGVTTDMARELTSRRYDVVKGNGTRVRAESKGELKGRLGHSPDLADAAFIAVDLARTRFGLTATEPRKKDDNSSGLHLFQRRGPATMKDLDVTSRSSHSRLE
jgi:hypothetical protein